MTKNEQARTVTRTSAYDIWLSDDGWIYHVLKKWQSDDEKPFGRWLCHVFSPMTSERGEIGDVYVETVKSGNRKVVSNPNAYTIMFHIHAERPGEGDMIDCVDTWPTSLKKALELYEEQCSAYSYVDLVAELYQHLDTDPVETQNICSFGTRSYSASSDTDDSTSVQEGESNASHS